MTRGTQSDGATVNSSNNYESVGFWRRYYFNNVNERFMNNETWDLAMNDIIESLHTNAVSRTKLDEIYSKFCQHIYNEMDSYIRYSDALEGSRKRLKIPKPFWCDELTHLWKTMHVNEKVYRTYKGSDRRYKIELLNEI